MRRTSPALLAAGSATLATRPAAAQEPAAGGAGDPLQALIEVLQDDAARAALIEQLLAGAEAAGALPEPAPVPETVPLVDISLARRVAEYTRDLGEEVAAFVATLMQSAGDVMGVFTGAARIDWPAMQAMAVSLVPVIAVTVGLFLLVKAIRLRLFRSLAGPAGGTWLQRLALVTGVVLADAAGIVLAWAGGHALALATGVPGSMDVQQSLFLNAFLLIETVKLAVRAALMPNLGALRLAPMTDATARRWYRRLVRLVAVPGYGLLLVVPVVAGSISPVVARSLTTMIVVLTLAAAIAMVLRNRAEVRAALSARSQTAPGDVTGQVLAALGIVWHWLAVLWLVVLFLIWRTSPDEALPYMLAATGQSLLAVLLGALAMAALGRVIGGGIRLPGSLTRALPLLEARLNTFVPALLQVARAVVLVVVLAAVAQIWGLIDVLGWLDSDSGADWVARLISAFLVVLVVGLLWIALSSFVEYRLNPESGSAASARERTLLSLLRNAVAVALAVIGLMLTLAQLGMNIAPLLAGAGVLGLAVGFGAQRLVQDVITGAFIQIENAMNEGDVVTVAGTTGVVERLTIRSVGLRDLGGTYHVVPFSSVDGVSNFMRGFGYHVANVAVAYREDTGEVKRLMELAFDRLMQTDHAAQIIGPFEMHGVTELADSAVMLRGRIRTHPGMQWAVGRAYTEIVKQVLDEAGVEIPFPHRTLYMGVDRDGSAPPLHLRRAVAARVAGDGGTASGDSPKQEADIASALSGPAPASVVPAEEAGSPAAPDAEEDDPTHRRG